MNSFEQLQQEKITLSGELLQKLVELRPVLLAMEFAGKAHQAKSKVAVFRSSVHRLSTIVRSQMELCTDQQCAALLNQELAALEGEKGALRHLAQFVQGGELVESVVRDPLMTIASREHILTALDTGQSPSWRI